MDTFLPWWNSQKLLEATHGQLVGMPFAAQSVESDTRKLPPSALFVALKGERFDGHDYLQQAHEAGAVAALVDHLPQNAPLEMPYILVKDTLVALQQMGRYRRQHYTGKVIGVTGSVGKTSTKEMLKLVLSQYAETYATAGNYNNHIGLPLTLCNLPGEADYAVIEMGMNHAGEIAFLSKLALPHIALITTIDAVHLEFFNSVEDIARAKSEIFEGLVEGGNAILPADSAYLKILQQHCPQHAQQCLFGVSDMASCKLLSYNGEKLHYENNGEKRQLKLKTGVPHHAPMALSALAVVNALKLPLAKAEAALASYQEAAGRGSVGEVTLPQGEKVCLIDDAYNASPVSMRAALQRLSSMAGKGRKVAILGEMLELGKHSNALHQSLAEDIVKAKLDAVLLVGAGMKALDDALPDDASVHYYENAEALRPDLYGFLQAEDTVLMKGSHGSGVYQLVTTLKAS